MFLWCHNQESYDIGWIYYYPTKICVLLTLIFLQINLMVQECTSYHWYLHVRNSNVRADLSNLSPSVLYSSQPQPPLGSCPSSPSWRLLRTWCPWRSEWSSFQTSGWIFLLNRYAFMTVHLNYWLARSYCKWISTVIILIHLFLKAF